MSTASNADVHRAIVPSCGDDRRQSALTRPSEGPYDGAQDGRFAHDWQAAGHYRILEKLGAGGMGEVYRAHDAQLDRDVAIKFLQASSFEDSNARARLLREARAAAGLNHAAICTIHEVGEAEGQPYIAMETRPSSPHCADVRACRDKHSALDWLERAYDNRESPLARLGVFWDWDDLRSEARFQDLLRRMNLPQ